MKAIHFDTQLSLRDVPDPEPAPGKALIRVRLAGICGTDRQILKGYSGFRGIPGHEFVGEVVGCDDKRWSGRGAVGEINAASGAGTASDAAHRAYQQELALDEEAWGKDNPFVGAIRGKLASLERTLDSKRSEASDGSAGSQKNPRTD